MHTTRPSGPRSPARERILSAAYDLFSRRGIRDVGVDEVIATSAVAKATLYRHFPSKDDLVLAVLAHREQVWTVDVVAAESKRRASNAEEELLAIFDVFDDWFRKPGDFEACTFINVLLEMGAEHPAGRACIEYLANIRAVIRERAERAGLRNPGEFACSWHILMKGSIICATAGDTEAAIRAQAMGRSLIQQYRTTPEHDPRSPTPATGSSSTQRAVR